MYDWTDLHIMQVKLLSRIVIKIDKILPTIGRGTISYLILIFFLLNEWKIY